MIVKKHQRQGRLLIAVCDKEILGRKFEEGDKVLDLTSDFYDGEETDEEDIKALLKDAYLLDFVGEKALEFALNNDLVDKGHIIKVDNIPHASCLFMKD
jgi:hypothetical protein